MKKLVLLFLASVVTSSGIAADASHTENILTVSLNGDGSVVLGVLAGPTACNGRFHLAQGKRVTAEAVKNMLAASLAAFSVGYPVQFIYQLEGSACVLSSLTLSRQ